MRLLTTLLLAVLLISSCSKDAEMETPQAPLPKLPQQAFIETITVKNLPLTKPSGDAWDILSRPDLYVKTRFDGDERISSISQDHDLSTSLTIRLDQAYPYDGLGIVWVIDHDPLDDDDTVHAVEMKIDEFTEDSKILVGVVEGVEYTFTYHIIY